MTQSGRQESSKQQTDSGCPRPGACRGRLIGVRHDEIGLFTSSSFMTTTIWLCQGMDSGQSAPEHLARWGLTVCGNPGSTSLKPLTANGLPNCFFL